MREPIVWACGGGTQSVAIGVLIAHETLPRPDLIVMADTSREATETWEYKAAHLDPLLAKVGLSIEVVPHSMSPIDMYAKSGDLLIPAFTDKSKLPTFCSAHWKAELCEKFINQRTKIQKPYSLWLGISLDEIDRAKVSLNPSFEKVYPLIDLRLSRQACYRIVEAAGLPKPPKSSCWMCPHRGDDQWIKLRDHYPADWEAACKLDEHIREVDVANGNSGVWLHGSRMPLRIAPLVPEDERMPLFVERPCASGYCFV